MNNTLGLCLCFKMTWKGTASISLGGVKASQSKGEESHYHYIIRNWQKSQKSADTLLELFCRHMSLLCKLDLGSKVQEIQNHHGALGFYSLSLSISGNIMIGCEDNVEYKLVWKFWEIALKCMPQIRRLCILSFCCRYILLGCHLQGDILEITRSWRGHRIPIWVPTTRKPCITYSGIWY